MEINDDYTIEQFVCDVKNHRNFITSKYCEENNSILFRIIGYYYINKGVVDFEIEIKSDEDKQYMKELRKNYVVEKAEKIMVQRQMPLYEIVEMKFAKDFLADEIARSMIHTFWNCVHEVEEKYKNAL